MNFGSSGTSNPAKVFGKNRTLSIASVTSFGSFTQTLASNGREHIAPTVSSSLDRNDKNRDWLKSSPTVTQNSKKRNQPVEDDSKNSRARHADTLNLPKPRGKANASKSSYQARQLRAVLTEGHAEDVQRLNSQVEQFAQGLTYQVNFQFTVALPSQSEGWSEAARMRFQAWIERLGFEQDRPSFFTYPYEVSTTHTSSAYCNAFDTTFSLPRSMH
jgi:hypothetical protein